MVASRKRYFLRTICPLQVAWITVTMVVARSQVNAAAMTVTTFHRARFRVFDCCTHDWTGRLVEIRSLRRGSVALRVVECIPVAMPAIRGIG